MKYKIILPALFLSCPAVSLYAQQPQQQNPDLNKQMNVTRAYEPTMTEASKIDFTPAPEDAVEIETEIDYSVLSSPLRRAFGVRTLSPYHSLLREQKKERPGYLNLGAGLPFHTQADLYYGSTRREKAVYGIYANHEGLFAKIKNDRANMVKANRTFNDIGLFGQYRFSDRLTVRAAAEYDYRNVTRYGYFFLPGSDLTQHFSIFKVRASGGAPFTDLSFLNARVGIDAATVKDHFGFAETSGIAQLKLGKNIAGNRTALLLTGEFAWASRNDAFASTTSDRILSVEPLFRYLAGGLTIEAGVRFAYDLATDNKLDEARYRYAFGSMMVYTTRENVKNKLFPVAKLQYAFAGGWFTPYIAAGGSYEMNSYLSLVGENPYLYQGVFAMPTSRRNYTAGFRGSIASSLSYHVFGRIEHVDNSVCFFNMRNGGTFGVVSDNIKTTSFGVELLSDISRRVNLYTKILYNDDKPDYFDHALGRPDWDILFRTEVRVNDRWSVSANARYLGRQYFYEIGLYPYYALILRKPSTIDIGLGIDYRIYDRFVVWLKGNNLTNDRIYRFNHYPEPGRHVTAGVKMSF